MVKRQHPIHIARTDVTGSPQALHGQIFSPDKCMCSLISFKVDHSYIHFPEKRTKPKGNQKRKPNTVHARNPPPPPPVLTFYITSISYPHPTPSLHPSLSILHDDPPSTLPILMNQYVISIVFATR